MSSKALLVLFRAISVACATVLCRSAMADYKEDIWYNRLAAELGSSLPTASNVTVTQVEAPIETNYMPDTALPEFIGKTIRNMSGSSEGASSHATPVGQYLYGTNTSVATGVIGIDVYAIAHWYGTAGVLRVGSASEPDIETNALLNLSLIGTNITGATTNGLRRLDYAIDRDGFTCVVSLDNTNVPPIPASFAHCYNAISVGRSDGMHSRGTTTFDEAGRVKPDLVAPVEKASYATPVVGAAAALLLDAAQVNLLTNAARPQCIRAILLAGATKDEFPTWERTPSRPLDDVYGAGELNVFNSYHTLVAGEQESSTTNLVAGIGWDFTAIGSETNALYFFDVPASNALTRMSVVLSWHRQITDGAGAGFDPQAFVPDLDLYLRNATGFTAGTIIDSSTSRVDTIEHIYRLGLGNGRYALEVKAAATTDYCLAWFSRSAQVPRITATALVDGNVQFATEVSSGVVHEVQTSTNLLNSAGWISLATTNLPWTNILVYTDKQSTNYTHRFYRLVPDP